MISAKKENRIDPLDPTRMASLKHWGEPVEGNDMKKEVCIDCGWGRLIFGQTFDDPQRIAETLIEEKEGSRDVALYVRDPHVVVSFAPQDLFFDPSLTYRLDFRSYQKRDEEAAGIVVRPLEASDNEAAINKIFKMRGMVPAYDGFYAKAPEIPALTVLIAEDQETGEVIGAVTGVDHQIAIDDADNGCSLWGLVVDPQSPRPTVGESLVRRLIEIYADKGRNFLDLSVMHDNDQAIALYDKLGFEQVPVYCIKNKNSINEQLFLGPDPTEELNIYAKIIVDEARRRGISVTALDAAGGFIQLSLGGRVINCRESLSDLTTAVAMSRCDDKTVTRRILKKAGLRVPEQIIVNDANELATFLDKHKRVVVKPARGEQGRGISVDLSRLADVLQAVDVAKGVADKVLLEELVEGEDLRIIVIDHEVVAAAIRRPAEVKGDGKSTIEKLIAHQSRRRAAATSGESQIPMDHETQRCIREAGYEMSQILEEGVRLRVRKTANLHTGGTIHDVTDKLHPVLSRAAVEASRALEIPLVGLDLMVPDVEQPDYAIIEANERPGLANHEPQPTVEKFVDMLFPYTKKVPA